MREKWSRKKDSTGKRERKRRDRGSDTERERFKEEEKTRRKGMGSIVRKDIKIQKLLG